MASKKTRGLILKVIFVVVLLLVIGNIRYNAVMTGKVISLEKHVSTFDVRIAEKILRENLVSNVDIRDFVNLVLKTDVAEKNKIMEITLPEAEINLNFNLLDYDKFIENNTEEVVDVFGFNVDFEESSEKLKWGYNVTLSDLNFLARIDVISNEDIVVINEQTLRIGESYLSFSDLVGQGYLLTMSEPIVLETINITAEIDETNETIWGNETREGTTSKIISASADATDANKDGKVDLGDFIILRNNMGRNDCSLENSWCNGADMDKDGRVGMVDFILLRQNFGQVVSEEPEINETAINETSVDETVTGNGGGDLDDEEEPVVSCNGADIDLDGDVDIDDFNTLQSKFGSSCSVDNNWCDCADINQDGDVDLADFIILRNNMGQVICVSDDDCDEGYVCVDGGCIEQTPAGNITGEAIKDVVGFFVHGVKGISSSVISGGNKVSVYVQRDFTDTIYGIGDVINLDPSLIIYEANETEEVCYFDWSCKWSDCENGFSKPYDCVDLNNCGVDSGKPLKKPCDCYSDWQCSDWGGCSITYEVSNVIKNEGAMIGYQERTCVDLNDCKDDKIEKQGCSLSVEINTEKEGNTIKIFDATTNVLVGLIKKEEIVGFEGLERVDISFIETSFTGYKPHCYNEIQDYDEEEIDCGGNDCPECEKPISFIDSLYWVNMTLWVVMGFLLIALLIILIKEKKLSGLFKLPKFRLPKIRLPKLTEKRHFEFGKNIEKKIFRLFKRKPKPRKVVHRKIELRKRKPLAKEDSFKILEREIDSLHPMGFDKEVEQIKRSIKKKKDIIEIREKIDDLKSKMIQKLDEHLKGRRFDY